MLLEQVYYFSQIAAAIGVIGSLVFVGLQVRGNARSVRSATTQAVHENFANLYFQLGTCPASSRSGAIAHLPTIQSSRPESPI